MQALELAAQEITRISQAFYEDMQDELNAEISRYVSLFTAGSYDSVRLDEQGQLQILTEGREVRAELLSRGTLEQIYLALRLAVMHNLYFYNKLTERIRDALDAGEFAAFRAEYSEKLSERA